MKQFIAFVKKEFYHILRDRRTLFILLGMPVIQILIFGFALSNEVKNANFVVYDQSGGTASKEIIAELDASKYFDFNQAIYSYDDIEKVFRKGNAKLAIVFPPSFNNDLLHFNRAQIQLVTDASDANTASTLTGYANAIIQNYQLRLNNNKKAPFGALFYCTHQASHQSQWCLIKENGDAHTSSHPSQNARDLIHG